MDANEFFVRQEVRKVESAVNSAMMRLRRADTLREVVDLTQVSLHPTIRFMRHQIHGLRELDRAAEKRAQELVTAQLEQLKTLPLTERREKIGRLRTRDWALLRGNFPKLVTLTEREIPKLLRDDRAEPKSPDGA